MQLSQQYAADYGLTLDTSLHLHDLGMSAFDGSNVEKGALGAFLEAVKKGVVDTGSYLLVESLDRLSRDKPRVALTLLMSLLNAGIKVVTLADGKVYDDSTNEFDLIVSITIMSRAHEESLTKSKRIRSSWDNKRTRISEKKLTAQCPRWLRLNDTKTEFEFIPERHSVVEDIVRMAMNGMGQSQIAKVLNLRNVPVFSNHGKGWHPSYVQKILTGTALYGEFQPHRTEDGKLVPQGDPVANYYPAVMSKEQFFFLQKIRSEQAFGGAKARKGSDVPNLLSGIVQCGYCGGTMVLAGSTAKRIRTGDGGEVKRPAKKVLVCDGARRGLGCYAVQWGYKDFERSFLTFCRGIDLQRLFAATEPEALKARSLSIEERSQAVTAEIEDKRRQVDNLVEAVALAKSAPTALVQRIGVLEQQLADLEEQQKALEVEKLAAASVRRERETAAESIRELINRMGSLQGEDLLTTRAALAAKIRREIEFVKLYPAGRLHTPEQIEKIKDGLVNAGLEPVQIEDAMKMFRTVPERQGRGGRGRYASRKDIGRFFHIQARNGDFRFVHPDHDDPSIAIVEGGVDVGKPSLDSMSYLPVERDAVCD
ncbi:hypothetical protein LMG19089_00466 [Ralstonia edaphis]|nr:hypothetical protein LMG19089_00466 [Ralstonia sp. LMG 6871]